ncbi:OmpA family protein [Siansivirga zeaxanthinifaciens]|uniref:Cell envelope biogenesis protein OmpA n=1 Tax=Siansivirga zeaxanthinifaciens CC-SAMT-1 TaxID=1454006 RepID=A0A0C5VUH1_9FLAO|nr:OmpA family protein [Siansivirga zeaxanthinifaciens]AJR02776.1 cell envelope biogenesis protein OmpA [Siansivirga zeaxanthinifaciens CC-SAMT-1]
MKKVFKLLVLAFVIASACISNAQQLSNDRNYFQIAPRIGYDFPTYNNNTPYIDYKGGIDLGLSLDYYFNWFGLGVDFDYIKNKPKSTYPTDNLFTTLGTPITNFSLSENKITRIFYGIGPNFQYRSASRKFTTELNTRIGLASIKGGRTLLTDNPSTNLLNFHAGYNAKNVLSFKSQLRFTYYFNENFGINAGAYYLRHIGASELNDPTLGIASGYHPFNTIDDQHFLEQGGPQVRVEPCDCDIWSVGVFAGITYKFGKKDKADVCDVCGKDHFPRCCATCGCGVTVTARDKFTNETLPNTDVVLTDLNGNIVQSGTTNTYGVIVFNDVATNDYIVKGKLYNLTLEETSIKKDEFIACKKDGNSIQKVIKYGDLNFILKGNVVECNTDKGIQDVDVVLKNTVNPGQKNTLSDAEGKFIFHLKQASSFLLKGNKDGYFSNEVTITTNDYDRNKSLFIDFEMCVNPCGKAITLDNIIFNLDKWDILPAARPDLDYVVKLMQENPTIKVEMSSHTDSRGSHQYNQELSQKRAQSTVDYLMSKGISRDRLIARGAGETELLNRCADGVDCAESEHTINRRTEFKVVCPQ